MVTFEEELDFVLPADLPERTRVIAKAGVHLALIDEANQHFNLTRITSPREAAIKHVLDSVLPWRLFEGAMKVLDAGSGAGFPGIPLALVMPGVSFSLAESTQKKARFLDAAVERLELTNVVVEARRAEEMSGAGTITARALAPLSRAIDLFAPAVRAGARVLLYKGPDVDREIADASGEAARRKIRLSVVMRYELPNGLGSRTIVEISR